MDSTILTLWYNRCHLCHFVQGLHSAVVVVIGYMHLSSLKKPNGINSSSKSMEMFGKMKWRLTLIFLLDRLLNISLFENLNTNLSCDLLFSSIVVDVWNSITVAFWLNFEITFSRTLRPHGIVNSFICLHVSYIGTWVYRKKHFK